MKNADLCAVNIHYQNYFRMYRGQVAGIDGTADMKSYEYPKEIYCSCATVIIRQQTPLLISGGCRTMQILPISTRNKYDALFSGYKDCLIRNGNQVLVGTDKYQEKKTRKL